MAFTDSIAALPFTPRSANGSGFLPPILRAMGHILYLLGCLADEAVEVTQDQGLEELRAAGAHWNARTDSENLSGDARARATLIGTAIGDATREWPEWTDDQKRDNLRDLAHRLVQFGADLDRELVGITGSDPGSSL